MKILYSSSILSRLLLITNKRHNLIGLLILITIFISSCSDNSNPVDAEDPGETKEPIELIWKAKALPETDPMTVSVSPDGTLYAINAYPYYTFTDEDRSLIYVSKDQGDSWQTIDLKTVPINNSDYSQDRIKVYHVEPVGQDRLLILATINFPGPEVLLFSEDGGSSWNISSDFYIDDFATFTSDYSGNILVGSKDSINDKYIHQSSDYGKTWDSFLIPENRHIYKPYFGQSTSSVFANADSLYYTTDKGQNWSANRYRFRHLTKNSNNTFLGIEYDGQRHIAYTSLDDGENWKRSNIGISQNLAAITSLSNNSYLLLDRLFQHLILSEDGTKWQTLDVKIADSDSTLADFLDRNDSMKIIRSPGNQLYLTGMSRSDYSISHFFIATEPEVN